LSYVIFYKICGSLTTILFDMTLGDLDLYLFCSGCGFVTQKFERVWLLTYLTHPLIRVLTRLFETDYVWRYDLFDSLMFPNLLRFVGLNHLVCLLAGTCACCFCSGSCWHLDFDAVVVVDSFFEIKPSTFLRGIHFSYIFVIWIHTRM